MSETNGGTAPAGHALGCDWCACDPEEARHYVCGADPRHDLVLCDECFGRWCAWKRHAPEGRG